jgi:hypothetical protein
MKSGTLCFTMKISKTGSLFRAVPLVKSSPAKRTAVLAVFTANKRKQKLAKRRTAHFQMCPDKPWVSIEGGVAVGASKGSALNIVTLQDISHGP